jgi:hypothetical protein
MCSARLLLDTLKTSKIGCLLLFVSFALSGCSHAKYRLGQNVPLEATPITSINAHLLDGPGLAPGEKSPLIASFIAPDGSTFATNAKGSQAVSWRDLAVTSAVVSVNKNGVVSLSSDPIFSDGKVGHVTITVPSHPNLRADIDIPVRYDYNFATYFSGSDGSNGSDGTNGLSGSDGLPGSIDPDHPSAGGNGSDGGNGTDGGNGGNGGDAPPMQVRVALKQTSSPLLQIEVSAAGYRERYFLVDPAGGSLKVSSIGGTGGSGGKGGRGGRGGSGGIGSPNGSSGRNGLDGHDGFNGSSGSAGSITVIYDPTTKPFLPSIHLSNAGGPPPVFQAETVAPMW